MQPLGRLCGLFFVSILLVLWHPPGQLFEQLEIVVPQRVFHRVGARADFNASHRIHGLVGHGHHMKAVVAKRAGS